MFFKTPFSYYFTFYIHIFGFMKAEFRVTESEIFHFGDSFFFVSSVAFNMFERKTFGLELIPGRI